MPPSSTQPSVSPSARRRALATALAATKAPKVDKGAEYARALVPGGGIADSIERMEYAVRGKLVLRAEALEARLAAGEDGLPFRRVTYCNIGNPQSVGQAPVTFVRQVLAAVVCPQVMLEDEVVRARLPADVVARAERLLVGTHGVGAYTESKGLPAVRRHVADALFERDGGAPADPDCIFLTNGASEAVKTLLAMVVRGPGDGVLIPTPQYPLYSATLQVLGARQVGYYLDEEAGWGLAVAELEKRMALAKAEGTAPRAMCVINPGNPTGQALGRENMEEIVRFCERHHLVLLADEVYQENVYAEGQKFVSFKRVVHELRSPIELASFHSISKGVLGECGIRGGFVELHNFHPHAVDMAYKTLSVSLCANVPGQVVVDLMMKPPVEGDPSYELFQRETRSTYDTLRRKAKKLADGLNSFPGVSCSAPQGAMYLFPRVEMPEGAVREAAARGLAAPDVLYCLELLEATGICVVPGSGFGQVPGTFHFRTTFLPPEDQIDEVIVQMRDFHAGFVAKYGGNV
jgi:aspartate/methionine/tyrosine aminotransferase